MITFLKLSTRTHCGYLLLKGRASHTSTWITGAFSRTPCRTRHRRTGGGGPSRQSVRLACQPLAARESPTFWQFARSWSSDTYRLSTPWNTLTSSWPWFMETVGDAGVSGLAGTGTRTPFDLRTLFIRTVLKGQREWLWNLVWVGCWYMLHVLSLLHCHVLSFVFYCLCVVCFAGWIRALLTLVGFEGFTILICSFCWVDPVSQQWLYLNLQIKVIARSVVAGYW